MTYELAIADRMYSSWSLRGWLMFERFGLPVTIRHARMGTRAFAKMLAAFGAAQKVPALKVDGIALWDSMAIAETLAERHPELGLWPGDPAERALARALVAEMHAGFPALRDVCPMNLRQAYEGFEPDAAVRADLARLTELWALVRGAGRDGPWLFGPYSLADAFYAPVAMRIAGYGLPVDAEAMGYVQAHLADPAIRRWRAMAFAEGTEQAHYEFDLPKRPWPGPAVLPARPVRGVTALNSACPYSDKPTAPDSLAEIDGLVIGFCNRFCRDKSVADAGAWPALTALRERLAGAAG